MAKNAIKCPACGIEEAFDADGRAPPPLHEVGEFVCENLACRARFVHGKHTPLTVVEPWEDAKGVRWTRIRFQNQITREDEHVLDLDPKLAQKLLKNIVSILIP